MDPQSPRPDVTTLAAQLPGRIRTWAVELGFADAGIVRQPLHQDLAHLQRWLAAGHHAGMSFMARDPQMRAEPQRLRPGTISVISVRMNCRPDADHAEAVLNDSDKGYIARYALGRDYHRTLRSRLLKLARRIEEAVGPFGHRVLADSAPALEKAMARNAGLGWIGKNTLLLNRHAGSWFMLGEIYLDLDLMPAQDEAREHCGSCSACLDICPTRAFIGPRQLDAGRCISYLTIEHHGPIPLELRPLMGNRIFGCDDCQLVCPWNRYASASTEADFQPRNGLDRAQLVDLFSWDEATWLRKTEGMALRRLSHERWLRNLAVALGNSAPAATDAGAGSGSASIQALQQRLDHPDPIVREHVEWALQQLTPQRQTESSGKA